MKINTTLSSYINVYIHIYIYIYIFFFYTRFFQTLLPKIHKLVIILIINIKEMCMIIRKPYLQYVLYTCRKRGNSFDINYMRNIHACT
jgi:hypothetical protein